jgi:hypothetical protein
MPPTKNLQNFLSRNEPQPLEGSGPAPVPLQGQTQAQDLSSRRRLAAAAYIKPGATSKLTAHESTQQRTTSPIRVVVANRQPPQLPIINQDHESQGDLFDATTILSDSENTTRSLQVFDGDDTVNIPPSYQLPSVDDDIDGSNIYSHNEATDRNAVARAAPESEPHAYEPVGQRHRSRPRLARETVSDRPTLDANATQKLTQFFGHGMMDPEIHAPSNPYFEEQRRDIRQSVGSRNPRDSRFHPNANLRREVPHDVATDNRPGQMIKAVDTLQKMHSETQYHQEPPLFRVPQLPQSSDNYGSQRNITKHQNNHEQQNEYEGQTNGKQYKGEQDLFEPSDVEPASDSELLDDASLPPPQAIDKQRKQGSRMKSQRSHRKRSTTNLDYNKETLYKMDYADLRNEPFDRQPGNQTSALPADLTVSKMNLEQRLQSLNGKSNEQQQLFFHQMDLKEWEISGEWFIGRFSDVMSRVMEARKERRAISDRFEQELADREETVRLKTDDVTKVMRDMRTGGEGILRGKTPSSAP